MTALYGVDSKNEPGIPRNDMFSLDDSAAHIFMSSANGRCQSRKDLHAAGAESEGVEVQVVEGRVSTSNQMEIVSHHKRRVHLSFLYVQWLSHQLFIFILYKALYNFFLIF